MTNSGGEQREQAVGLMSDEAVAQAEHEPHETTPRIYVASLADYNDGRLLGRWLEADREPAEIYDDIQEVLSQSELQAEEWAIHDFEGFGDFELHEYEAIETVSRLALGIAEHGPAFAVLATLAGTDPDMLGRFEEVYLGTYPSLSAFAEQLAGDLGLEEELDRVSEAFRPYVSVDYDQLGRDLGMDLAWEDTGSGGIYLFDLR